MFHTRLCIALIPLLAAGSSAAVAAQRVPPADAGERPACRIPLTTADPFRTAAPGLARFPSNADPIARRAIRRGSGDPWTATCDGSPAAATERPAVLSMGPLDITLLPAGWRLSANSAYPRDDNNGLLWEGRGPALAAHGGFAFRVGPLSGAIDPVAVYASNESFATTGAAESGPSVWRDPLNPDAIDRPQRFGAGSLSLLDPGQSFVRIDAFGARLGFGTENLWWGPALRYPLVMSNTAPGFPHVFVGPAGPTDIGIGRIDAEFVWGHLRESEYYDDDPTNDRRLFAGFAFEFRPRGLDGLSLGATRAYLNTIPPDGLPAMDYLYRPYIGIRDNPRGQENPDADDQLFSVFARWSLPATGFEVYGEWAREDHWVDFQDLLREPDHAQAYVIGGRHTVAIARDRRLAIHGEVASLGNSTVGLTARNGGFYYRHAQVEQGYTHRGQLLGAWIGPRSADAQFLAVDLLLPRKRIGAYVERIRRDPFSHDSRFAARYGTLGHDLELTAGLRGGLPARSLDIAWELAYSRRWNRNFIGLDQGDWSFPTESNLHAAFTVGWVPRRARVGVGRGPAPAPERP